MAANILREFLFVFIFVFLVCIRSGCTSAVSTVDQISDIPMSFLECNESYGNRGYLDIERMRVPPMLLTFPGSGTTMSQLLIEYASGIHTGSIYHEDELYSIMPGLQNCGQRLSVVKAHIKDILFKPTASLRDEMVTFKTLHYVRKCHKGIIYSFDRFIIVLRNPWSAIWSNFQRDYNTFINEELDDTEKKTHSKGIPVSDFNATKWQYTAMNSPHYGVGMYNFMWNYTHPKLFKKYQYSQNDDINFGNSSYTRPKNHVENTNDGTTNANKNILLVRYEDLLNKEKRVQVLKKMIDFTGLNLKGDNIKRGNYWDSTTEKARTKGTVEEEETRRLKCAFILSDRSETHRSTNSNNEEKFMKTKDAYQSKDLVCKMWKTFQSSRVEMQRYGYYHGPSSSSGIPECE